MTRAASLENSAVVFKDAHPHPRFVSPSDRAGFRKNLDSDDHFDRSFARYRNGNQTTIPRGLALAVA
jgi:hypothetical protein